VYEAIAPALTDMAFPHVRSTRIVAGEPFFRMCEAGGAPNATTHIDVLQRDDGTHWRYRLQPDTGRKHQLRVHMAALGAPILGDPFYPVLQEEGEDALEAPLQLLARSLSFIDPLSGELREFTSERTLGILTPRPATSAQRDTHPRSR
jgi:tRNA pseudouridine32 synthase/23S rRNA pseudouridine746 synthase